MTWDKKTKELVSYIFAAFSLLFGFCLCVAGFIVSPLGIVHESVLWILGQCFVFAGSITGISLTVDNIKKQIKSEIKKEIG